jgi:hypothetical protein
MTFAIKSIVQKLNLAHKEMSEAINRQWRGQTPLKISIPARPDWDTDLIVCGAIREANSAIQDLYFALDSSDALIRKAQEILAVYIVPDAGITDHDVVSQLLGLLDGPEQREVKSKTIQALVKVRGELT